MKFLAVRDCLAHLLYLEAKGKVHKKIRKQRWVYSLAQETDPLETLTGTDASRLEENNEKRVMEAI